MSRSATAVSLASKTECAKAMRFFMSPGKRSRTKLTFFNIGCKPLSRRKVSVKPHHLYLVYHKSGAALDLSELHFSEHHGFHQKDKTSIKGSEYLEIGCMTPKFLAFGDESSCWYELMKSKA